MPAIHGWSGWVDGRNGTVGCSWAAGTETNDRVVAVDASAISTNNPISARFIAVAASCSEVSETQMRRAVTLTSDVFNDPGIQFQFEGRESYPISPVGTRLGGHDTAAGAR